MAQPQQQLGILNERFKHPALLVRLDEGAAENSGVSVTKPRIFRAWPLREKMLGSSLRVLTSSQLNQST